MIHKIEDGDILKILPMIVNGKVIWGRSYKSVIFTNTQGHYKPIYDNTDNDYFSKMNKKRSLNHLERIPDFLKFAFNCYINGEIKIVNFGRSFIKIISEAEPLCVGDNKHLFIKSEMTSSGFIDFNKSFIDNHDWKLPIDNPKSKEEWSDWIINNQPDFESFLEKNNIFNNIEELKILFGGDLLSEVISDNRDKKIESVLINK